MNASTVSKILADYLSTVRRRNSGHFPARLHSGFLKNGYHFAEAQQDSKYWMEFRDINFILQYAVAAICIMLMHIIMFMTYRNRTECQMPMYNVNVGVPAAPPVLHSCMALIDCFHIAIDHGPVDGIGSFWHRCPCVLTYAAPLHVQFCAGLCAFVVSGMHLCPMSLKHL
jgi:hypothetical protein